MGRVVETKLLAIGWIKVVDVGETNVYFRWEWDESYGVYRPIMLAVYTDDFCLSGTRHVAIPLFVQLHSCFGFAAESLDNPELQVIIGLRLVRIPSVVGTRRILITQREYIETICGLYCEEVGITLESLKPISTPCKCRANKTDVEKRNLPGRQRDTAGTHIGRLLWVVRGTRPDVAVTTSRLSSRQTRWSLETDEALNRVYRYLWSTRDLCLLMKLELADLCRLGMLVHMDSDHAGDRDFTPRSRTGHIEELGVESRPRTSWMPLAWSSTLQDATAKSSSEAEAGAAWSATFNGGVPIQSMWEQILNERMTLTGYIDNDAARIAIANGDSRKLAHLRKHHDMSLSAISEYYERDGNSLIRVDSAENWSDGLTKPLDHVAHWKAVRMFGMCLPDGTECGGSSWGEG